jgi:hypothetical protein
MPKQLLDRPKCRRPAAHGLVQYGHRLSGPRAHRQLPAALREELVARGNAIRTDVTNLRRALRCPEDAPAQPR